MCFKFRVLTFLQPSRSRKKATGLGTSYIDHRALLHLLGCRFCSFRAFSPPAFVQCIPMTPSTVQSTRSATSLSSLMTWQRRRVWCNLELLGTKAGIGLGTILGTEDPKQVSLLAKCRSLFEHSSMLSCGYLPDALQKAKSAPRIAPAVPPPITPATPLPKACVALFRTHSGDWLRYVKFACMP